MQPLLILLVFPIVAGIAAQMIFRDARRASLAASIGAVLITCVSVQLLAPGATWNWIAALLVSLLPISIAVTAALFWYGRRQSPKKYLQQAA